MAAVLTVSVAGTQRRSSSSSCSGVLRRPARIGRRFRTVRVIDNLRHHADNQLVIMTEPLLRKRLKGKSAGADFAIDSGC
jgi:hypothetical protein